jgi:NAD(P)-dependent dehydrogenase (short-subunit alcohol dehydrogenase family)
MSRIVMVNGATGGIGRAIARRLLADGYRISIGARGTVEDAAIDRARDDSRAMVCRFDAADEDSARDWAAATVAEMGGIDVLINCVGILSRYTLLDDTSDLDAVMQINVAGPAHCMKHAYPALKQGNNPKIINFVSHAGLQVVSKSAGYAASKYALRALSQAMKHQGWDDGIRTTAIFPGWVNTDMIKGFAPLDPAEMTQPEDLATLVACLIALPATCAIGELVVNCQLDRI